MEKKIIKLRNLSTILFCFALIIILAGEIWLRYIKSSWSIVTWIYWLVLIYLFLSSIIWKLKTDFILSIGLVSFVVGAIFSSLFPLSQIGETILKLSFTCWIVGVVLAIISYKRNV